MFQKEGALFTIVCLLAASLGVGILIGAVGVGGILLIPALNFFAGLTVHVAMATALFTFIFTGVIGTVMFQKRGSVDWRVTIPVCIGGAAFGFAGAWANAHLQAPLLSLILSLLIVFAGVYTLWGRGSDGRPIFHDRPKSQQAALLAIGAVVGFGSGLTGVGGPALSVPIMVLLGFAPLTAIGTSQVIQILAAISGTIGNLRYGSIDFQVAGLATIVEIVGVGIGVHIAHIANSRQLRQFVGTLCFIVGTALTIRILAS